MTTTTKEKIKTSTGHVVQVVGVVVDVEFAGKHLPPINFALKTELNGKPLLLEVAQHLSESTVRTVALSGTDGLTRGDKVESTGAPISVPVGEATLGRMFNVIGEPIDGIDKNDFKTRAPIHKNPPPLEEQAGSIEVLETGIKVIDLICPIVKGGKVGLFGGAGVGKTVLIKELISNIGKGHS